MFTALFVFEGGTRSMCNTLSWQTTFGHAHVSNVHLHKYHMFFSAKIHSLYTIETLADEAQALFHKMIDSEHCLHPISFITVIMIALSMCVSVCSDKSAKTAELTATADTKQ